MHLGVGWAMLDAQAGDNRPHRHLAHQISLALEGECQIITSDRLRLTRGEAALIPAGLTHRLEPSGAALRTIYIDPMFRGTRGLVGDQAITRLAEREAIALSAVRCGAGARRWIKAYTSALPSRAIDHRLQIKLASIEPGMRPAALARNMGLSSARLRELAIRDFGVPTSKLLQWRQLQHAILALCQSHSLAHAAAAGAFSDQAHFTRRLVEWFGVTPSVGLTGFEISVVR